VSGPEILRLAAFTADPAGGNPAGVVLAEQLAPVAEMQRIAAEVGYSETAFIAGDATSPRFTARYYSPAAEVAFCGHATIAAAIAMHERLGTGDVVLETAVGPVPVGVATGDDGAPVATLHSTATVVEPLADGDLDELLGHLGWGRAHLDPSLPPRVAYAGVRHPVVAVRSRELLASLAYDFDDLRAQMLAQDWTTVQVIWRASATVFHARDPFPVGSVVEDPATGAAAAALGGYLRELGLIDIPTVVTVHQGEDMGRPSLLTVDVRDEPGVRVSGRAVAIV
jgi:PhzF family phenazine biosynthesis protein